jgi:hypothetical protein
MLATRSCTFPSLLPAFHPLRNLTHRLPYSLENELSRLNRNKERRFAREKQKGALKSSTGDSPADGVKAAGTQRKCANCGQVGHIKTNKKCVDCFHFTFYLVG